MVLAALAQHRAHLAEPAIGALDLAVDLGDCVTVVLGCLLDDLVALGGSLLHIVH